MRSVTLEVPANNSRLRKSGGADAWLRPLIGDIVKKKMSSHSCLTLMNDIVHSTLKKTRESEKSIHEAEEIAKRAQLEADNWKEQFENAQGTIEELQESRNLLEQQKQSLTSELVVAKTSSSQFEKDKERLECFFSEQLSKSSEEIRELKELLDKKEEYAGELVQNLTQVQADLKISSEKVHALESSHASLKVSLDSHLAEHQVLTNDLAMWEREYKLLEEKFDLEVSWTFLNSRRDALMEASQENFDLDSELAKVLETIERTQQSFDFPSSAIEAPVAKEPVNDEVVAVAVEVEDVAIPASEGEISTA
uniref:Myosin-6-like n=1 Tax=Nicotiana tabacum TaxID=4097 RepID=A0A1S4DCZ0_TOBAC|nr:PREDICTED: myosin-6-like [Nicotiana tabacum]